jgi:hypothetical protein
MSFKLEQLDDFTQQEKLIRFGIQYVLQKPLTQCAREEGREGTLWTDFLVFGLELLILFQLYFGLCWPFFRGVRKKKPDLYK